MIGVSMMSTDIMRKFNIDTIGSGDQTLVMRHGFGSDQTARPFHVSQSLLEVLTAEGHVPHGHNAFAGVFSTGHNMLTMDHLAAHHDAPPPHA